MEIIGTIAAILTTGAFIPQAFKTIKTQQTEDLSLITFSMLFLGTILWATYGYFNQDHPIFFANVLTGFLAGIILIIKIKSMIKNSRTGNPL